MTSTAWSRSPYTRDGWLALVAASLGGRAEIVHVPGVDGWPVEVPIVAGSTAFGAHGFACGAIGYGGTYRGETVIATYADTVRAVNEVCDVVGLECIRLVSPLFRVPDAQWPGEVRRTSLKLLPGDEELLLRSYAKSRRYEVLHAQRDNRIDVSKACDLIEDAVVSLVHDTQRRVGAPYLTPESLVHAFCSEGSPNLAGWGALEAGRLTAVALFVVGGTSGTFYLNGRSPSAGTNTNAYLLHVSMAELQALGVRELDLGISHSAANLAWKLRWNTEPGYSNLMQAGPLGKGSP